MDKISSGLEEIARLAKSSKEAAQINQAIQAVRDLRPGKELGQELAVWQSKLDVILKEPIGREGMAKHARYWAEKVKNAG